MQCFHYIPEEIMSVVKSFTLMFPGTLLQQSAFALCVFALTLLAPAGWILHHIPVYKQR